MEESTDVSYFERRDSQFFHELTPECIPYVFSRLHVAAWQGDRPRHYPLRGLTLFHEHRRLLKDKSCDAFKRIAVFPHATSLPIACCLTTHSAGAFSDRSEAVC
jgi:hypothetical protein